MTLFKARRTLAQAIRPWVARSVDRIFNSVLISQSVRAHRQRASSLPSAEEQIEKLTQLTRHYESEVDTSGYFRAAGSIEPTSQLVRKLDAKAEVLDLSWPSDYRTFLPEVDDRYRRVAENLQGAARLWRHREPRPVAIVVHGYMTGQYRVEEYIWPVQRLFDRGLDVALLVLPHHGVRGARGRRGPPPFPSSDPRLTHEGFRHVLGDLRDLRQWFETKGHPAVGMMGMSLGAYTTALAATVEPALAFAVALAPLSCLADFARDHGQLHAPPELATELHHQLDLAHRIVSPLHRTVQLAAHRLLVVAGEVDQVTPLSHARRLASHWKAPLKLWPGGHLLQFGRSDAFDRIEAMLTELELLDPRP